MQVYATFWALLPPIIAIVLALITKEVYSSLFLGIIVGCFLYVNGDPLAALQAGIGLAEGDVAGGVLVKERVIKQELQV